VAQGPTQAIQPPEDQSFARAELIHVLLEGGAVDMGALAVSVTPR
jgi:hypothetical protein